MADEADMAQADCDALIEEALYRASHSVKPLPLTGECHYCFAICTGHFCDHECAHEWDYEQNVRKKQGLA